ncbi:acyl-CoA synthetase [Roseibium sp. RKSG952]|uniref:acyl-CoA synthetase n=1 Tax=Roseibium sp. RKSG952 TaxID=2529384 RepID=UPI0012BBB251|nr:acyl-CoA synthetase [Roseibium sp. RKSG952]MTH95223.1 acyl-CoA synthetase [Roseibium sp. RKSG952]
MGQFDLATVPVIQTISDVARVEEWLIKNPPPFSTSYELLEWAARSYPDRTAIRFMETPAPDALTIDLSYRDLLRRATQAGHLFMELGGREPVVSSLLPNTPEGHLALWGAQAVGTINPLNPFLQVESLIALMNAINSDLLVVTDPGATSAQWHKLYQIVKEVKSLQAVLVTHANDQPGGMDNKLDIPLLSFNEALEPQPVIPHRIRSGGDDSAYFHTGGTTGIPKIVRHTHKNEIANVVSAAAAFPGRPGDVCLVGLPLFHVNAVLGTGLCSFLKGQTVLIATASGFRTPGLVDRFWEIVSRHQVAMFSAVPTVLSMLLDVPGKKPDAGTLKHVVSGAAPLSVALANRFVAETGARLIESYGLTEGSCISTLNPVHGEQRIGSIGFRVPAQEQRIVAIAADGTIIRDCGACEVGSLLIRGENVSRGYLDSSRNPGVFLEGGWLNTGDLARRDADGYVWLTGRSKDLIIRGGHNIDPSVIEEAMMQHPSVGQAAAVGQPDAHAGEVPCVYVQLRPDRPQVDPEDLRNHARTHIAERAAIPVYIEIMPSLPLTAVGKVLKPALRREAVKRVVADAVCEIDRFATVAAEEKNGSGIVVMVKSSVEPAAFAPVLDRFPFTWQIHETS